MQDHKAPGRQYNTALETKMNNKQSISLAGLPALLN